MLLNNSKFHLTLGIILVLALSRIIPHPPNFTPILGMAVFAGAIFEKKIYAFLIPLLAMIVSDLFLGMHSSIFIVYIAVCLNVIIGICFIRKISYLRICLSLFFGSLVFFIITNFFVWLVSGLYPLSYDGFIACYTMALPFFQNTIISTFLYGLSAFFIFDLSNKYLLFRPKNY